MEYVILGFLLIRSLSQYDLLKALSREVSPFYQPSLGSIQNGLKKLQAKGYITKEVIQDTGRKKNLYSITEEGKEYFEAWMLSEYSASKFDAELTSRLFFLGHLEVKKRKEVLQSALDFVSETLNQYQLETVRIEEYMLNNDITDIIKYQIKTLELGICSFQATKHWLSEEIKGELYE